MTSKTSNNILVIIIDENFDELTTLLDVNDSLLSYLEVKSIITDETVDLLRKINGKVNKAHRLLTILRNLRTDEDLPVIMHALGDDVSCNKRAFQIFQPYLPVNDANKGDDLQFSDLHLKINEHLVDTMETWMELEVPNSSRTTTSSAECDHWNYNVTKFLGVGSFGVVFQIRETSTRLNSDRVDAALKIVVGQTRDVTEFKNTVERECQIMDATNSTPHENVVTILAHKLLEPGGPNIIDEYMQATNTTLEHGKRLCCFALTDNLAHGHPAIIIKMELCGPTLQTWLLKNDKKPEQVSNVDIDFTLRKQITLGMISGLKFLHSKNILHRDLKPENIYFSHVKDSDDLFQCPIKLGDFGQCRKVPGDATMTQTAQVWSEQYRAREAKEFDELGNLRYGPNADWFSVGLIIFEMFHLIPKTVLKTKFADLIGKKGVGLVNDFPDMPNLKDIIIGLTRKMSDARVPTINKIRDDNFVMF
ncbi:serine/threonine-protein kinase BUR1 isoform X1 [Folsomia candida]|uniref:Interferon-induced, double-stranded RNA-activated protein kinase n=1 Tax=Folsomia candida TaxID=158441 RepID=A0A226DM95_FOLCA|nr:serine/threonine-protein kinase BUR1 isoform X1 [Folsomia candida]XP_035713078.1 serine/threonine-protein kinase BUR1 isoform X1 [Folsomia candida]XP_035713079.1 serine/threonine-protein kinase BUR1 isoform X1 [Folsomia candida]XP_035713080.1 serine/threonine-protein kinase BUR1 isoform X1 [Folsomia candida]OXA46250.1 Interferon-induced, double-stranded RNA-activated protein kinase [Folsomia candida]